MVDMVWKLGTYIEVNWWLTWCIQGVLSFYGYRLNFFLPSQSLDQRKIGRGGKINP